MRHAIMINPSENPEWLKTALNGKHTRLALDNKLPISLGFENKLYQFKRKNPLKQLIKIAEPIIKEAIACEYNYIVFYVREPDNEVYCYLYGDEDFEIDILGFVKDAGYDLFVMNLPLSVYLQ